MLRYLSCLRRRLQLDAVAEDDSEAERLRVSGFEVEPEPEDENPEPEVVHDARAREEPLDSSDDASESDELATFESVLPSGMRVALAPLQAQLEFKSPTAKELKGRLIMYNWASLGWWLGTLRRPSADKSKLVKVNNVRQPANFVVAYELDGAEGPHCLTLAKYGQGPVREGERWVLLEPAGEAGVEVGGVEQ